MRKIGFSVCAAISLIFLGARSVEIESFYRLAVHVRSDATETRSVASVWMDEKGEHEPVVVAQGTSHTLTQLKQLAQRSSVGATAVDLPSGESDSGEKVILELASRPLFQVSALGGNRAAQLNRLKGEHAEVRALLRSRKGLAFRSYVSAFNGISIRGLGVAEARRRFQGNPLVKKVWPDTVVQANLSDTAPVIEAPAAWGEVSSGGRTLDGSGVKIGIIDTGVDYTHADLGGCLGAPCKVRGGYDFVNRDPDPMDDQGHGTHVAATAAGVGFTQSQGRLAALPGIAPGSTLYAYKVLDARGSGHSSDVIAAIERCGDPNGDGNSADHLDICSMSLGGPGTPDDPTSQAVDRVTALGVLFVVAAGNSGPGPMTIQSPGTSQQALTVGAACKPGQVGSDSTCSTPIASFSSRGPVVWLNAGQSRTLDKPDLVAPGHKICAAQWGDWYSDRTCQDSEHIAISGTSMATPVVSGAAALLIQARPDLGPTELKAALMANTVDLGQAVSAQGKGMLNIRNAIAATQPAAPFVRIEGLPLTAYDKPGDIVSQIPKSFRITNTSGSTLAFTPAFSSTQEGLSASFASGPFTLSPGQAADVPVTFSIDHRLVPATSWLSGTVSLLNARGPVEIPFYVTEPSQVAFGTRSLDLGVNLPEQNEWNGEGTVEVRNLHAQLPAEFTVTVRCCDTETGQPADGTTVTAPSTLRIPAGGTVALPVLVHTQNSRLKNGRYRGSITLASARETLTLPLTFYKGYGFRLQLAQPSPMMILMSRGTDSTFMVVPPGSPQIAVFTPIVGPWNLEAQWFGGAADPVMSYHVIKAGLHTDVPVRDVLIDRAQASVTLSLDPQGPSGPLASPGSIYYKVVHRASGQSLISLTSFQTGHRIKVSPVPSEFSYVASALVATPTNELLQYFYRLDGGISADTRVSNLPGELVERSLSGADHVSGSASSIVWPGFCHTIYMPPYENIGSDCFFANWQRFQVGAQETRRLFSYSNAREDLAASDFPDHASLSYVVAQDDGSPLGKWLTRTSQIAVTSLRDYLWPARVANGDQGPARFLSRSALRFPPGNHLDLGGAPPRDATEWSNSGTGRVRLGSQRGGIFSPHLWSVGSAEQPLSGSEGADQASTYQLRRGGEVVAGGLLTLRAPLLTFDGALAPGAYEFELNRNARIRGQSVPIRTLSRFQLGAPEQDSNPPTLTDLQLVAQGVSQSLAWPSDPGALQFEIDPVGGLVTTADGKLVRSADALTAVTAQRATSNGFSWEDLAVTALGGGRFYARVPGATVSGRFLFRISASDQAGNSTQFEFQVPTGELVVPPVPLDLIPPQVRVTAPRNNYQVKPGGSTVVQVDATDNRGMDKVQIFANGSLVCNLTTIAGPYLCKFDVPAKPVPATYALQAIAWDLAGHRTDSAIVTVRALAPTPVPSPFPSPTSSPSPTSPPSPAPTSLPQPTESVGITN